MVMKVIITGGSGFAGSHLIQYMVGKYPGNDTVNLDISANADNLKPFEDIPGYRFVKGDIGDKDFVLNLFAEEKPGIVINFVPYNEAGVKNLLDACRLFGIRHYHQVSEGEAPAQAGSTLAASIQAAYGLPVTVSRCCNLYGPCSREDSLIPMAIARALSGERIYLENMGENVRDWLYVADYCRAIDLIVNEGKDGGTYDICSNSLQKDSHVVRTILKILGRPETLICYGNDRGKYREWPAADTAKITEEIGWVPSYDLDTGLRKTIRWHMTQQY